MSVQLKILSACLVFVGIIALVGGLAQRQAAEMGRLAVGIYDNAFMGTSYVDQAQAEFLRFAGAHQSIEAPLGNDPGLQKILDRLDIALERATSERTRESGAQARAMLATLATVPAPELRARLKEADVAIVKLVKKFSADGLEARDNAEELAARSTRLVLIEIAVAVVLALGLGWLVGRNLSRPLVQLVRVIGHLAGGNLEQAIPPALAGRKDEIGAVSRAAAVFREAMRQNDEVSRERERQRVQVESEKTEALRNAADIVERETTAVAQRSQQSGTVLIGRAEELAESAGRMLASIESVNSASEAALQSCEVVAASGEQLSLSAREISKQISISASEIANTARAGDRAERTIGQLSESMGQIGSFAKLIGEIAARTNLLALNASVEAARAGDAGRGFAVVAGEVKSLAAQTAQSTQEIARNIGTIQTVTKDAVDAVRHMVERVSAIEVSTQAVAAAVEQQTAATSEIARNVAGTADAMRVVSGHIDSVSNEAHCTDAAVTEMRTVAAAVANQITELQGTMVRIVRTSSDAANRRSTDRRAVMEPASLFVHGTELAVTCSDLSLGGARIVGDRELGANTRVRLRLRGLPDMEGNLTNSGREFGVRFDWEPHHAPIELKNRLGLPSAA